MRKLAEHPRKTGALIAKREALRLRGRRRKLSEQLAKIDERLATLNPPSRDKRAPDSAALNRWFDELSQGLEGLPVLPPFSRADIYDDHD
jgi:hypothetical protein